MLTNKKQVYNKNMYKIIELRSKNHMERKVFKIGRKLIWIKTEYRDNIHIEEWAFKNEKTLSFVWGMAYKKTLDPFNKGIY
jgi:hypothetical protein